MRWGAMKPTWDRGSDCLYSLEGPQFELTGRRTLPDVERWSLDFELGGSRVSGRLSGPGWGAYPGRVTAVGESFRIDTLVDAEGAFDLDLPPGSYSLRASREPLVALPSEPLVLAPGEERKDLVVLLDYPGAVAGSVTLADGRPAAQARVRLKHAVGGWAGGGKLTDAAGRYLISVPPGRWGISASLGDWSSPESEPVLVEARKTTPGSLSLTLHAPKTHVRVEVLNAAGAPVDATVSIVDAAGRATTGCARHPSGFELVVREFGPFPPGDFRIEATASTGETASTVTRLSGERLVTVKLVLGG